MHRQVVRDLELFVEVARRKSFSEASNALGIPISSLSRRIKLFEAALGLHLLDRTTRKVVLTAHGEAYLERAGRMVDEAQRAFDDLSAQVRDPSGFLKIAVPMDFWAVRHLSGVITEYTREHKYVHVHVDLKPPPIDLASDDYDLFIATDKPTETSLVARKVGVLESGLFASHSYLLARGHPGHPRDLERHSIISSNQGDGTSWTLICSNDSFTFTGCSYISCNSASLARRLALINQGIAAAALINVERDVQTGRLERVLPEWQMPPTPIYIVTTSGLLPVKTQRFIEFATKHLSTILCFAARGMASAAARNECMPTSAPVKAS